MTFDWEQLPWIAISFTVAGAGIYLGVLLCWLLAQGVLRIFSSLATRRARRRRAKAMRLHPASGVLA